MDGLPNNNGDIHIDLWRLSAFFNVVSEVQRNSYC